MAAASSPISCVLGMFKQQYTSYMKVGSGGGGGGRVTWVQVENTRRNYLDLCFIHGVILSWS